MGVLVVTSPVADKAHDVRRARYLEKPQRIAVVESALRNDGTISKNLRFVHGLQASIEDLSVPHSPTYMEDFRTSAERGDESIQYREEHGAWSRDCRARHLVDCLKRNSIKKGMRIPLYAPDHSFRSGIRQAEIEAGNVPITTDSFEAIRYAFGSGILAVHSIHNGETNKALCLVRPPGHHVEPDIAMGFGLGNTIARVVYEIKRVDKGAVVFTADLDAHHGNGIQDIFYEDPSVITCSIHGEPECDRSFPKYTGFKGEKGFGAGFNSNFNIPFRQEAGNSEYRSHFHRLLGIAESIKPNWFVVGLGADGHTRDLSGAGNLTEDEYFHMGQELAKSCNRHAQGRMVIVLEGGYELDVLPLCVIAFLEGVLSVEDQIPPKRNSDSYAMRG